MANDIANEQIRDTATYTYDLTRSSKEDAVFQYANNLDASVDVTVKATYDGDDSFSNAKTLGTTTVSAASVDFETLSDPWDQVRFEAVASASPTSGSLVMKEME